METKANYIVTGAFTLAVIAGVFGFIYWVQSGGTTRERATYRIVFAGSVSGLHTGASVLFDGMRVGGVTKLTLDPHDPRKIDVLIALDRAVPVRADTKVALEFQGLTGLAGISLTGGAPPTRRRCSPTAADCRHFTPTQTPPPTSRRRRATYWRAWTASSPRTRKRCGPRCAIFSR